MTQRIPYSLILLTLTCTALLSACRPALQPPFHFDFTMESVANFKCQLHIQSDTTYMLIRNNAYMAKMEQRDLADTLRGRLTADDYSQFVDKLTQARLFTRPDQYGLNAPQKDPLGSTVYTLHLMNEEKEKFIFIRDAEHVQLPSPMLRLIEFISQWMNRPHK